MMSCNGCRVLRKKCSASCILRPRSLWIKSPYAQGNAALFVFKFFGHKYLIPHISSVPENERSAMFQSLLFEARGRKLNPENGVIGLLSTGNWNVCLEAMEAVLIGGTLRPFVFQNADA